MKHSWGNGSSPTTDAKDLWNDVVLSVVLHKWLNFTESAESLGQ